MTTNHEISHFTGLILISGEDKPGITHAIFDALSPFAVSIIDIEQVVIKQRLLLTVLITLNPAHRSAIEEDLTARAGELDLDIAIDFSETSTTSIATKKNLTHVVVLSAKLNPKSISQVAAAISESGANIERISRLASEPIVAIEFVVSESKNQELRQELSRIAAANNVDIALSPGNIFRHARKLVQLDVDSTLIAQEVIELLAAKAGVSEQVVEITQSAMRGELDFEQSLRARVLLLKGLSVSEIKNVRSEITLTPGAKNLVSTLQALGHTVTVVSGGFIDVIEPLLEDLNIKLFKANKLEIENGILTGNLVGEIIDRAAKAQALREFAQIENIDMEQTIAIGDGANDLDMISLAGMGIAFNAKPVVRAAADNSLTNPYLDSVLYLLGIATEDH